MNIRHSITAMSIAALWSTTVQTEPVYVINGINVTETRIVETRPVDVYIDGLCIDGITSDIPSNGIVGPLDLPTGSYDIDVRLSNSPTCDSGPLAVSRDVKVRITETKTLVAHLDSSGETTLSEFSEDVRPVTDHSSRVTPRHDVASEG